MNNPDATAELIPSLEPTDLVDSVLLATAQENSPDGILVVDAAGHIASCNRRFIELWDIPDQVIAARSDEAALQAMVDKTADPEAFVARIEYLYAHRDQHGHDEIMLKDGRTLDRYSSPMFGSYQEYLGRAWYFRDITDFKQQQTELHASEQRLKLAAASGQIGIWEYNPLTSELFWDDTMFALYGARREDFSGAYDAWTSRVHPEDIVAAEAALKATLDKGKEFAQEFRIIWPNGEIHHIKSHAHIINNEAGQTVRLIGTNRDIWAYAHTRQELKLAQAAIDMSQSAFYRISAEGVVLYVNDAACHSLGYDREELVGMQVWDFDPDFSADAWAPMWEGLRQTRVINIETRHRRKDGTIFPVEVICNIINADGEEYSFAFVRDITERKQAQQQILRKTQLYRALSEVNQAIVRMEKQEELFPLVCRCAVEFGGIKMAWIGELDETSGLISPVARYGSGLDYLKNITISAHDDAPEGHGPAGRALRENRAIVINDFADSATHLWRHEAYKFGLYSGASFPIQRGGKPFAVLTVYHEHANSFDAEIFALLDDMSKEISFALNNFDHELSRKMNEESLRLAASVYESSSEAMKVCDADGIILTINPAFSKVTGYLPHEIIGKHSSIFNSSRHNKLFYNTMQKEIDTVGHWQGEVWHKHKSGSEYMIWLTTNSIFNLDGSVYRRISLFFDVTERKQRELEIRQLNTALEQRVQERTAQIQSAYQELESFTYSVSHDLRAPLRSMTGFSHILLEDHGPKLDAECKRLLKVVCGEAERMGHLVDDLLEFSRMNRLEMKAEQCDMMELTQKVYDSLDEPVRSPQLKFKLRPLPPAEGDPSMLRQVLFNLLTNALKFSSQMPTAIIEVGAMAGDESGMNAYYVRDNGVGFDQQYAHKLFAIFQRLHTEDEFEGTGVGLALVQRIVTRHGGKVWAEGKINQGATFYFSLPALD